MTTHRAFTRSVCVLTAVTVGLVASATSAGSTASPPLTASCDHVALKISAVPGIGPSSSEDQNVHLSLKLAGLITADTGGGPFAKQSVIQTVREGGLPPCHVPGLATPDTTLKAVSGSPDGNVNCDGQQTPSSYPFHGKMTFTLSELDPITEHNIQIAEYVNWRTDPSEPSDDTYVNGIVTNGPFVGADTPGEGLFQTYDRTSFKNALNCQSGDNVSISQFYFFTNGTPECVFLGTCPGAEPTVDSAFTMSLPTDVGW